MTKLEAWKAWGAIAGTADRATEFTLEQSSHGRAFGFAWDAACEACAQLAREFDNGASNHGACIAREIEGEE